MIERLNESGELRKLLSPLQVITYLLQYPWLTLPSFRTQCQCSVCVASVGGLACFPVQGVRGARSLAGEVIIKLYSDVLTVMRGGWSGVISADTCNIVILRCTHCDEGGLVRCDQC